MAGPIAIDARLAMINGNFDLPKNTLEVMPALRAAASAFAQEAAALVMSVQCDWGRLIAALDLIQQTKDVLLNAVILPHAPKNDVPAEPAAPTHDDPAEPVMPLPS
jgi:hypothetical protein